MNKNVKLLILFFIFMSVLFVKINIIYAEKDCNSYKSPEAKAACEYIEDYCLKGAESFDDLTGCVYDEKDSNYTSAMDEGCYGGNCITLSGTLTRGYQAINKDGEAIFAGCYKVEFPGNGVNGNGTSGKEDQNSRFAKGTYYIFKILDPNNLCDSMGELTDIVPPNKINGYDGHDPIGSGAAATYKWTAVDGGECPLYFGITSNTNLWTNKKKKHIFANTINELDLDEKQFRLLWWNSQKFETNAGCTVEDKVGFEKALTCYENAINSIKNKSCPSDLSNISAYRSEVEGLANKCGSDLETLYQVDYLKESAEIFQNNLTTASNEKLTSCVYSNCGLTSSEISKLTGILKDKTVKDGCYNLEGSDRQKCTSLLKSYFEQAKLSESKINCLIKNQEKKDEGMSELEDTINDDQEQHISEELQESEELLDSLYEQVEKDVTSVKIRINNPSLPNPETGSKECSKILGSNLTAIVKASITIIQVIAAIIAIVKGMMTLIPPIIAHDADALKKATKTLTTMAIILVIIFLFKPLLRFFGSILEFDTSCIL